MKEVEKLIKEAIKAFTTADHLTYVSYPLLKEQKLMVIIIQNLHSTFQGGINALLLCEQQKKLIKEIPLDQGMKLKLFEKTMAKHKISQEILTIIQEVDELMKKKEDSIVNFTRRESYVLCDKNYKMKKLNIDLIKTYIFKTRPFIEFLRSFTC